MCIYYICIYTHRERERDPGRQEPHQAGEDAEGRPGPAGSGVNRGQREHKGSVKGYPKKGVVWCSLDS